MERGLCFYIVLINKFSIGGGGGGMYGGDFGRCSGKLDVLKMVKNNS